MHNNSRFEMHNKVFGALGRIHRSRRGIICPFVSPSIHQLLLLLINHVISRPITQGHVLSLVQDMCLALSASAQLYTIAMPWYFVLSSCNIIGTHVAYQLH